MSNDTQPGWEKHGRTHILPLEENSLFEIVICRDHQHHVPSTQWVVRAHGRRDTFLANLDGTIRKFKPVDPMEETPGPEVFAAALQWASEIVQKLNASLGVALAQERKGR